MQTDIALELLLPWLQNITAPTLWIADENALPLIESIRPNPLLTVVTNRYDIYSIANQQNLNCVFSDFNHQDYPSNEFAIVLYRISKEKAIVNHIIQQAITLAKNGRFIVTGFKQEGIKSYGDKLIKSGITKNKLQKNGPAYLGEFLLHNTSDTTSNKPNKTIHFSKTSYHDLQHIHNAALEKGFFYSKPGLFGWNKIDQGTEQLLAEARQLFTVEETKNKKALDLGCGYGWIFLNLDDFQFNSICASDNNAGAIIAATENTHLIKTPTIVTASDCANTITSQFDYIFCNPPFHQGFKHSQTLTKKFIQACKNKLKKSGKALFVLNEFVTIDNALKQERLSSTLISKHSGFKVLLIEHT